MVFLVHSGDSITGTSIACFGLEMVKAITDAWGNRSLLFSAEIVDPLKRLSLIPSIMWQ